MYFIPEIVDADFPHRLATFLRITGKKEWERRFAWITKQIKQNSFLKSYAHQLYSLELQLENLLREIERTGRVDTSLGNAERYRLFAFVTATSMIHERLNARGKKRLAGMILGGLRDKGLTPLQLEISAAVQLLMKGFDVTFSDMENGSGYDFLARKDDILLEVECKRVGLDLGRKIPRLEVLQLHQRIWLEVKRTLPRQRSGIFMRVTLPARLTSNYSQQQNIARVVGSAFRTGVGRNEAACRVELADFGLVGTPFMNAPGLDKMREFIEQRFHSRNRELMIIGSPGMRALVVSVESQQRDTLLDNLFDELSIAARTQFSKTLPGILCVQFVDMTSEQIGKIGSAYDDDKAPKQPSALLRKTSAFLTSDKRSHVLSVVFQGQGVVSKTASRVGSTFVSSVQEQGNAYFVTNEGHPLAKDRRYAVYAAPSKLGAGRL